MPWTYNPSTGKIENPESTLENPFYSNVYDPEGVGSFMGEDGERVSKYLTSLVPLSDAAWQLMSYKDMLTPQGTLDTNNPLWKKMYEDMGPYITGPYAAQGPEPRAAATLRALGVFDPAEAYRILQGTQYNPQTVAQSVAIASQGVPDGTDWFSPYIEMAALALPAYFSGGAALSALGGAGAAGAGAGAGAGMELGLSLPFEWGASGGMGALGGIAGGGMDLFTGAGSNLSGFNFGSLEEIIANAAAGNSPAGYSEFLTNPLAEFGADLGSITAAPGFWESVSKYGGNAVSAVKNLLGSDGSMNDLASLLGKIAPAALGVIASNQQSKDYLQLADKYMGFGAPSRARYESSFVPGFSMANEPGYADALDQTTKSFLHKASIAGNPADSPNAWMQTLKDVNSTFAYPALQEFRRVNAGAGGLANMAPAAINAEGRSVGAERGIYDALGAGFADVFSPPKSLSDILREIRAL